MACHADGIDACQFHGVGFVDRRRRHVESPGIYVPRIILLGQIFERIGADCRMNQRKANRNPSFVANLVMQPVVCSPSLKGQNRSRI